MHSSTKSIILKIFIAVVALVVIACAYFYFQFTPATNVSFALIFDSAKAAALGLNPKEVYDNMMTDIKPYTVLIEPSNHQNANKIVLRQMFFSTRIGYYKYPGSLLYYRIKAGFLKVFGRNVPIEGELQAEPVNLEADLDTQKALMNRKVFMNNIEFAKKVGFSKVYISGVEWWYWMTQKQRDFGMWTTAKDLLRK